MKRSLLIGLTLVVCACAGLAQTNSTAGPSCLSGYPYPPGLIPPDTCAEVAAVLQNIDMVEQQTLQYAQTIPINPMTRIVQIRTLGKLLLYDSSLSVKRNEACTSCHSADTGFTGPISDLNLTTVDYPGSVRYRFGPRKPKSYAYSPYSQVFHLDPGSQQFYGGNFWDQHATGWKLQNPASQQAQDPPVGADELGFSDPACVVRRISQAPYLYLFKDVWGSLIDGITWPGNTDQICSTPTQGPPDPDLPGNVPLDDFSRSLAKAIYDQFGMSIAAEEAGPDVSPFNSKFDYAITHPSQPVLSPDELAGWELFDGKGRCNLCHLDNLTPFQKGMPQISNDVYPEIEPLFADFTAFNLGVPKNLALPYLYENNPDQYGVTPNPQGLAFTDLGLGAFLSNSPGAGAIDPNPAWPGYAPQNNGKFQTASLRDSDKRPDPTFVKSYFHNGFMKSLKEVVHFYNTRDVLPKCPPNVLPTSPGVGTACWPAPEFSQNLEQRIGNLGLTDQEKNQIVRFLQTLTDGYFNPAP